jgi:ATP-dependent DNA helicase RecG
MPTTAATHLQTLLAHPTESELVEFKEAKADYDFRKLGQYFSALCNEANLKQQRAAWQINIWSCKYDGNSNQ